MQVESRPADDAWLRALLARSPLVSDASLREHWQRVIGWLPLAARAELADVLLEGERLCQS